MLDDHHYTAQTLQLSPGDTLCLVTDGITEAFDAKGQAYGSERLTRLLRSLPSGSPPQEVMQQLRGDVASHTGDTEATDDLTLLVLRWGGVGEGET